ncbi:hypothetical protein NQ315_011371 [Exocentrus adspersus]|uniref:Uncharacterized protein n=1 Tax=Exocentrus adspersus TaxID=1586481 RepID=A0AAV8V8K5_9CUCU|nr:hypothetical protein NQ315_011371 [Exocentrus adspersus]
MLVLILGVGPSLGVQDHLIEVVAGAYWKPLPQTLTYEATIPLIYKTSWREDEIFELKDMSRSLKTKAAEWTTQAKGRSKRSLDFLGDGLAWCCGVATQHKLDQRNVDEHQLQAEIGKLHDGLTLSLRSIDCKQHLIPMGILQPTILRKDLKKLDWELEQLGQGLAIPPGSISRYYQLPICDCAVTEESIVIHVRVPITQRELAYHLAVADQGELRTISGAGLHQCKPFHDKLCYIPRFSGDALHGPTCARKLFSGTTVTELSQHCPLSCHGSTSLTISEIEEGTYVVTHPKPATYIRCGQNTTVLKDSAYSSPGAVKIHVPCNCEMVVNEEVIIPQRYPCLRDRTPGAAIAHILPAAWSTLKSFYIDPTTTSKLRYSNLTECLDTNWTTTTPYTNLTTSRDYRRELRDYIDNFELPTLSYSAKYAYILLHRHCKRRATPAKATKESGDQGQRLEAECTDKCDASTNTDEVIIVEVIRQPGIEGEGRSPPNHDPPQREQHDPSPSQVQTQLL